ncbi:MAG: MgtC/SapB family protein [Betaproteobacteria bacterium]|jgi:uncharacterized membrane protein (DUF4010 family)
MLADEQSWIRLAVALGIGLMIGAERERRKGMGAARAPAGIRTFAAVSLLGAVSASVGDMLLLAISAASVAAFSAIAYARTARQDPGLTTEIALLLTLLLGAMAMHEPAQAAGLAATVALLLAARERIHHFVRRVLTEQELNDALVLAAATLVILPLAPDRHLGPYAALNPHNAWTVVVLMLAIGAAGHVAMRLLGSRLGLAAAGFASGFVSSTATIGSMGAYARRNPELLRSAASGAVLSSVATVVQMTMILAVTSLDVLKLLLLPMACAGFAAFAAGVLSTLRNGGPAEPPKKDEGRAFSLASALLFAALITGVTLLSAALVDWLGRQGLLFAATLTGLADAHATAASAASLAAGGGIAAEDAAIAVLLGLSANSLSKTVVALASGGGRYALQVVPGVAMTVAAAWLGWLAG